MVEAAANSAARALGYDELKVEQLEVVSSFYHGNDVFVTLPTGFGKSLCYAILPKVFDTLSSDDNSIVVVITPLTALINDQVFLMHLVSRPIAILCIQLLTNTIVGEGIIWSVNEKLVYINLSIAVTYPSLDNSQEFVRFNCRV